MLGWIARLGLISKRKKLIESYDHLTANRVFVAVPGSKC